MKFNNVTGLAIVLIVAIYLSGCVEQSTTPSSNTNPDGNKVKIYSNTMKEPIYTIGDSITAGNSGILSGGTSNYSCNFCKGNNNKQTYQYWLDSNLNPNTSSESTIKNYFNKGIAGQTCDQIYSRFSLDIANNSQVILMCGINDITRGASATEVETDIKDIYNLSIKKNNTLIILNILPYGAGLYKDNIISVNSWLETFTSDKNITLVDLHTVFSDGKPGYINSSLYGRDGLHPNMKGFQEIGKQIWIQAFNSIRRN